MYQLRLLYGYNLITYFCSLLTLFVSTNNQTAVVRVCCIVMQFVSLALTLVIFDYRTEKLLKSIRYYCIPDFVVRVLAVAVGIVGRYMCKNQVGITVTLSLLIMLLGVNLTFEKIMSIRLQRLIYHDGKKKKSMPPVLISVSIGYLESIVLCFMLLLPYNFRSDMGISGYVIWSTIAVILFILYLRLTLTSLMKYYKTEKNVRNYFIMENVGIVFLLIILSLYGYTYGFTTTADAVFYIASLSLTIPRFVIRHKRLAKYNEGKVEKHAKVIQPKT